MGIVVLGIAHKLEAMWLGALGMGMHSRAMRKEGRCRRKGRLMGLPVGRCEGEGAWVLWECDGDDDDVVSEEVPYTE
jgi:hypothetical protein